MGVNLRNMAEEEFEVVHCKPELPNFMGEEEVEDVQCKSEVFMNHDGAEVISCEPELRNNIDEKEVEAAKSELAFASVDVSMGTSNTEDTFFIPVKCEPEWKSENEEEPFSDFKDEISDEEDRTPNNLIMTRRNLNPPEIEEMLVDIGSDSEYGGDLDAEDVLQVPQTRDIHDQQSWSIDQQPRGSFTQDLHTDFGSDDSVGNPDYEDPIFSDRSNEGFQNNPASSESETGTESDNSTTAPTRYVFSKQGKKPTKFNSSTFSEPFGPNVPVSLLSPLEIFQVFFTHAFLTILVQESNKYAIQKGNSLDLSLLELQAFIGVLIIMGFHTLPSIRHYWSSDPNFHVSRISSIMSLKRFLKIMRFLHMNDNEKMPKRNEPGYDRLYKVRPLLDHLNKLKQIPLH
ncbi:uncharacterized protein [Anabrus simplex]|uniref:uncharacterized protein isoform X2 n=1 Tax=Anabrus simplex TaxID=316456 RepID=UPI0035A366FC